MILLKSLYEQILAPVTVPLEWILVHIHTIFGFTWAWSIIAMTVIVRLALVPLTVKQQQSMRRMQAIQPEIKKLQAKYKDDRQLLNQKMMEYYKENKVNPFASCLPLLAQMPIFLGLFVLLRHDDFIKPGDDVSFFFGAIPDITTPLNKLDGVTLAVLMTIYVGSQVGSTLLMPSSVDPKQKYLFAALPVVFAFFIVNQSFPVGLMLYWITTNLWTVGQAAVIRKWYPPPMPVTPAAPRKAGDRKTEAVAKKPATKPATGEKQKKGQPPSGDKGSGR
jgi:YidC/Oxa1 family membrane protein insertase